MQAELSRLRESAVRVLGGPGRARVVLVLAAVLGLSGADGATISATTSNLETAFHVGNTQIGLLLSVVGVVGAVCTLPFGVLTDRTKRTRLLSFTVAAWAAGTLLSGVADSYLWLLVVRALLGVSTAAAGPAIASLTGDYFPAGERGRMYGLIIGGELAGTGVGFVVSGDLASLVSWRVALSWVALPALALAWAVHRLPEPARGGQGEAATRGRGQDDLAEETVRRAGVEPNPDLVLHDDPTERSLWWAVKYVLRVRTNVVAIVASSLGYFYFAGLRSFAIMYVTGHYGISKPVADILVVVVGAGAVAGVFAGGRLSDRLLRGVVNARILVPAVCLLAIGLVLAPAIALTSVAIALPLFVLGGVLLGAPNPPLDAARLDIMPSRLWGRAEAVRTLLRTLGESAAPTLFGYVSQYVFGSGALSSSSGSSSSPTSPADVKGLEYTFLVFLLVLVAAGLLALLALRTYPRDVATAEASEATIGDRQAGDRQAGDRQAGDHAGRGQVRDRGRHAPRQPDE
jgi:predicted MFS family arabinose efflux permease